jgi:hypothetical protein
MRSTIIIIGDVPTGAAVKILAVCAVIWLACWLAGRLLEEREHRANMRRTLERALARRNGRRQP